MMDRKQLVDQIREKRSFLCVGLDPDPSKVPEELANTPEGILEFNKAIIEATSDHCVAFKPNTAFYECWGKEGWWVLEETLKAIPDTHFVIADAKRGDIGNTSSFYAKTFFDKLGADALTIAPYMGHDSILPFLEYKSKWVVLLGLTSNEGALDFQFLQLELSKNKLYERVLEKGKEWGTPENLMFVIGATQSRTLSRVRELVPDNFLLVPGVGAQGGDLREVAELGLTEDCGLLVNASRSILFAGSVKDFQEEARKAAARLHQEMEELLDQKGV